MLDLFFIISIVFALIILIIRNNKFNYFILICYSLFQLLFVYFMSKSFFQNNISNNLYLFIKSKNFINYINFDKYSIFFSILNSILFLFSSISSINKVIFMKENNFSLYSSFLILFYLSMIGVVSSSNIMVLWIFIEATTLTGGVLIYQEKTKHSLEAAWKYIFICSVAIAISFVGIIFLSLAFKNSSLSFNDLKNIKDLANPFWLELGFGFILIGFGTKAGLAPTHAWLPDAHSEAPSQVSALLSGALLNTAILGIYRVLIILPESIKNSCKNYLLIMGLISLFISSIYMLKSKNYKRLLAYSSIENMGLIAIGLSLNGIAAFSSFLLMICHSLTKSSLFLSSGVIKDLYNTVEIKKIKNIITVMPLLALALIFGFLSIAGFPVFLSFFAKFNLIYYLIMNNRWFVLIIISSFLLLILYSFASVIFNMLYSKDKEDISLELLKAKAKKLKFVNLIQVFSALILLLMAFALGVFLPKGLQNFILNLID